MAYTQSYPMPHCILWFKARTIFPSARFAAQCLQRSVRFGQQKVQIFTVLSHSYRDTNKNWYKSEPEKLTITHQFLRNVLGPE